MAIKSGYTAEDLAKLGPDVLTRKRLLAEAMLNDSTKQRKIAHPLQGLQQLAETLVNGLDVRKIDKATMTGQGAADKDWSALFGGSPTPSPGATGASMPAVSPSGDVKLPDLSGNDVYTGFIDTVKSGGVNNPYALAAIAATGQAESGYDPKKVNASWPDPSQSGQPGTSGGIMSWRNERLANLRNFAQAQGGDPSNISPATQAKFFLQENPELISKLNAAKSPEEAASLMANAWKFAGYDQAGGEAARRLGYTQGFVPKFQGQAGGTQVASLDPAAGMSAQPPMPAPAAQAQIQGPQPPAPPLPPPTSVPNASQVAAQPPVSPQGSPAPQQLAQALTGGQPSVPAPPQGPSPQDLAKILSNPWVSDERKQVARMLLGQQGQRQQAQYEQQLQQSDPKYRQDLEKGSLELENLKNPRMSPAEQAADQRDREKMAFDREKFDAEVKKGQWQKLTDGRLYNQTTGEFRDAPPAVPGSVPPKFDDISGLRKEIQQLPSYKNLSQALPIYRSMAETAGRNSKASDLNLVYGLGKIMDPTSVVREGEMVMVKNTASLPDWFQGAIASLNGGAALTPETRQAIMREAYGRVQGYDSAFKQDTTQYQGIVERNKFNPADVIPDFGTYEPWKPADASAGPTQIKSVDEYRGLAPGTQYIDPNGKLRTKQ